MNGAAPAQRTPQRHARRKQGFEQKINLSRAAQIAGMQFIRPNLFRLSDDRIWLLHRRPGCA